MTRITENELVKIAHNEAYAFEKLYQFHYQNTFCFIQNRINNLDQCALLTKQVFIETLVEIKQYNFDYSFENNLYKVAIDKCDAYCEEHDQPRHVALDQKASEMILDHIGQVSNRPTMLMNLRHVFKQLSFSELQLLELRFFKKMTFLESAFLLKISERLVRLETYRLLSKVNVMMAL